MATSGSSGVGGRLRTAVKAVASKTSGKAAANKTAAPDAPAKTTAKKATPAAKPPAKKAAPAAKQPATKSTTTTAPTKTPAHAPAKVPAKPPATKTSATKAPPTKASAGATKASPAKKAPAKAATTKAAPAKKAATKATPAKTATRAPAKTAATIKAPARGGSHHGRLRVREDESPWTAKELAEVRTELTDEVARLRSEIVVAEQDIADLIRDSGDGAGDDQADAGSKTYEREQEMSLANNARDLLAQAERALHRIDDGTYGLCESCGNPIGKLRLQAFPRATMCIACKEREERR